MDVYYIVESIVMRIVLVSWLLPIDINFISGRESICHFLLKRSTGRT